MGDCLPPSRWALVTGASSGIGQSTAVELARVGFDVIAVGRNKAGLTQTQQKIPQGSTFHAVECDLAEVSQVNSLLVHIREILRKSEGILTCLVNNAGIFEQVAFSDSTDQSWESQFYTNLMGPVRVTRGLFPELKAANGASVINVASTLALRPTTNSSAYASIKAAMVTWTKALALEWAPAQIRVNVVCPGIVDTPIHSVRKEAKGAPISEQLKASMSKLHPLGRMGRPDEIAHSIVYLSQTQWVTGSTLTIDGGISL